MVILLQSMGSKQKLDMGESEFDFLHHCLVRLSKTSVADYKSMLLMVKSFAPNSLRLKQVEYELAKDSGDTNNAAHILSQLFSSHREPLREEICKLFDGLKKTPPDKVSIDIFSRLSHSTQRELFNAYFSRSYSAGSDKADVLLYLLNLKEIRSQIQLIPTIISLAYRALRDGEASLARSSTEFLQPHKLSSASNRRYNSPQSSQKSRTSPKMDDSDEGEEGEVLGDDDEEEELLPETRSTIDVDGNDKRTKDGKCIIILNEYRCKMTYELLPATYQVFDSAKIDGRLLEKMVTLSFNFLFEYLASLSDKPLIVCTDKMNSELPKTPCEYLTDCLRMSFDMFQWPLNLFLKQESGEESNLFDKAILKPSSELLTLLEDSWDEILLNHKQALYPSDTDIPSKKRRSAQRREDPMHTNPRLSILALQSVTLFWVLLLDTAKKYVCSTRPSLISKSSVSQNEKEFPSNYPLDLTLLFPSGSMLNEPFVPDASVNPLLTLARLWRFRKYTHVPKNYSLGTSELDMWDAILRPSSCLGSAIYTKPSLEDVVCFDLTLAGFLTTPWMLNSPTGALDRLCNTNCFDELISFVCSEPDISFVRWILNATPMNPFTQRSWTDTATNREAFVKNFSYVATEASPSDHVPTRISQTCWLIPYTQSNVSYLGCKIMVHWLYSIVTESQLKSTAVHLGVVSVACVLCQVDTMTKQNAELAKILPLPCKTILKLIEENWCHVRSWFLNWIKPPISAIADMSLINKLVAMEAAWLSKEDVTGANRSSEFMDACVSFMKSEMTETIEVRLQRFVTAETDLIISCLRNM